MPCPGIRETPLRVMIPVIDRANQAGGAHTFETAILLAVDRLTDQDLSDMGIKFFYYARTKTAIRAFEMLGGVHNERFVSIDPTPVDHCLLFASGLFSSIRLGFLAKVLERRIRTRLAVFLRKHCDIIWNLHPDTLSDQLPYVVTVWDLQHRLQPMFPEVSHHGEWQQREDQFRKLLPQASFIVGGTNRLQYELQQFYGVDPSCVWINPLPVDVRCSLEFDSDQGLSQPFLPAETPFIFYPAQFWSHKNHRSLLIALKILQDQGIDLDLVLTGSDMGLETTVRGWIKQLGLCGQVHILGFVPRAEVEMLYRKCRMMCFPSFFGPDNIPPLEAMALGAPVAAADVPGARDQLQEAALFFNPSDPHSIADAIQCLHHDSSLRNRMIRAGYSLVGDRTPDHYVQRMLINFQQARSRIKASQIQL
jgi:glycosyltransferase involved in cell wall biosynthesis